MTIDLDKKDIADILSLINTSSFRGESAEKVVALKEKLQNSLKEDGKRDTS